MQRDLVNTELIIFIDLSSLPPATLRDPMCCPETLAATEINIDTLNPIQDNALVGRINGKVAIHTSLSPLFAPAQRIRIRLYSLRHPSRSSQACCSVISLVLKA